MIGNCDCCDRENLPVSMVNVPGEPVACYLCQGDSNHDPYGELERDSPQYSQLLESWAECRRLLSEERNESERLREQLGGASALPAWQHIPEMYPEAHQLIDAARYAVSAIDRHLGDSDPLNGSDNQLFIACQKLSAALALSEKQDAS